MGEPLILYSATTRLAYSIGQTYYGALHYVWCAPVRSPDAFDISNPRSSDPIALYWGYRHDVERHDGHSDLIERNRQGIIRGAEAKARANAISADVKAEIEAIALHAPVSDFAPLLLVMPYDKVRHVARPAQVTERAKSTSREYVIDALPRAFFDVLGLEETNR